MLKKANICIVIKNLKFKDLMKSFCFSLRHVVFHHGRLMGL